MALGAIALWSALATLGVELRHVPPFLLTGLSLLIGSLIALACARTKVLATEAPVLCLSNQHERDRAVLLAMPYVAPPNTEPSLT